MLSYFPDLYVMGQKMESAYTEQVMALSNLKSWGEFVMAIVIMAFFPALFEEIFFRGAVQNLLERWWQKPLLAIIATSRLVFTFWKVSLKSGGKLHLKNMTCWNRQAYCMTFLQIKTHNIGF
ncbi:MAG: CPBP family intramembrane metalloprotease [Chitinophagaceae bacterium]|nr:CPBP family intramembrane metalloprotease [Chitinophagaceae bacterium]